MAKQNTRVVAPDLEKPRTLRVPDFGGDTYAPPPKPPINNDMEMLARALGSFSSAISAFANDPERKKAENEKALAEAQRYAATTSNADLYKAVQEGRAPRMANPMVNGFYMNAIGTNEGEAFASDQQRRYGAGGDRLLVNPDGSWADIDKQLAEDAAEWSKRIPSGDVHANRAFQQRVAGLRQTLFDQRQRYSAQKAAEDSNTILSTNLRTLISDPSVADKSPEEVGKMIDGRFGSANTALKGSVPYRDMDDALVGQLKLSLDPANASPALAKNVLKLLDAPRKDPNTGQTLPSLSQNPRFADDVARLRAASREILEKEWQAGQKAELSGQALSAFQRGDGSFDAIGDTVRVSPITGKEFRVSGSETKEAAVGRYNTALRDSTNKQLSSQPADVRERQVFLGQVDKFIGSGVVNPEWKGALTSAVEAVGDTTSLTDPQKAGRIKAAANLYSELRGRSPAYVDSLLSDDEKSFYESYTLFRQLGQGDDVALRNAAVVREPENRSDPGVAQRFQEVQAAVGRQGDRSWFGRGLYNAGDAQTRITRMASQIARAQGVSAERAVEIVGKKLEEDTPVINGQALFTRSAALTKDRVPVVEKLLDNAFEQNKAILEQYGVDDASDLSIRFTGGHYQIIKADTGAALPVIHTDPNGKTRTAFLSFTDRDLQAFEQGLDRGNLQIIINKRPTEAPPRLFRGPKEWRADEPMP